MSLKRLLYTLFVYLVFPLVLLRLLWRSRSNPDYQKRWAERFGLAKRSSKESVIWVHAVSVGEAIAAKPLIEELLKLYSDIPILITTTTPTGSDRVQAMFAEQIQKKHILHSYFPYDLLGTVSRFVKVFQPKILIVVETEIWPNLYVKCHQKQIPVVMVNARLSEKSTQSYLKIKGLIEETLSKVNIIAVRSEDDAKRFVQLGAKSNQIKNSGNIKYDIYIDQKQVNDAKKYLELWHKASIPQRLVFVAASTHKGEDEKILFVYLTLLKQFPTLLFVLVPRHPERFNEVYEDCIAQLPNNLNIIRHSQSGKIPDKQKQDANVILGDSMGEMQMWYATADLVFIGGSLVETGGHNPLEATLFGVPVVSGPHMFNFEDIASELSTAELLYICDDEFEVCKKSSQILLHKNETKTKEFDTKAQDFMQQKQGVIAHLVEIISKLLK